MAERSHMRGCKGFLVGGLMSHKTLITCQPKHRSHERLLTTQVLQRGQDVERKTVADRRMHSTTSEAAGRFVIDAVELASQVQNTC